MSSNVLVISPAESHGGVGKYTEKLMSLVSVNKEQHVVHPSNPTLNQVLVACYKILLGGYSIVHVQNIYYGGAGVYTIPIFLCCLLKRVIGGRIYFTAHEIWDEDEWQPPLALLKKSYVFCYHTFVALSSTKVLFLSERAQHAWVGISPKSAVIPHGVPTDVIKFEMDEAREKVGCSEDGAVVVLPGFINDRKDHQLFVSLARQMPDVSFVIAGGARTSEFSPLYDRLKETAPENLRVTGKLNDEPFHAWFDAATVVVLPYTDIWQSGIFNNCAAHSSTVLTSDIAYFSDIRDTYDCVETFGVRSPGEAEEKLRELLSDSESRNRLAQNISEYASQNSFDKVSSMHEHLYASNQVEA